MQKEIIKPIDRELIKQELKKVRFFRKTNFSNNEIYIFNHHQSPILMQEIGRLREVSFRTAGGGTGKDVDIDKYDTSETPYEQMVVWDPELEEFLGGYRYILGNNVGINEEGKPNVATGGLLNFSDKFVAEYLPRTIELGRSFVQPIYQSSKVGRKALFALDNLWDGLGAMVEDNPEMDYFFGKVTMYTHYNRTARDYMLYFLKKIFPDTENLMAPKKALLIETPMAELEQLFNAATYKENFKELSAKVRALGEVVPPLINTYMGTSPNMMTFGTSMNVNFGHVEETGILITIKDIYKEKYDRFMVPYLKELEERKK